MKKMITLFASVMLVASAFAQYNPGKQNDRDYKDEREREVVYNDGRYHKEDNRRNDRYASGKRERDIQIAQINREYDYRINAVRNKWFTSKNKKQRILRQLEEDRRAEIRNVYAKYNNQSRGREEYDRRRKY